MYIKPEHNGNSEPYKNKQYCLVYVSRLLTIHIAKK